MKGIIVVDMPERCIDCKRAGYKNGIPYCNEKGKTLDSFCYKPEWCPIKKIPDKKKLTGDVSNIEKMFEQIIMVGFNNCIEEILKGEKINGEF